MTDCDFQINDAGHHVCQDCGYVHRRPVVVLPLRRNCPAKAPRRPAGASGGVWGLGDHVGLALAALGITAARVSWLIRLLWPKGDCGCEARKQKLNRFGAWLLGLIARGQRRGVLR